MEISLSEVLKMTSTKRKEYNTLLEFYQDYLNRLLNATLDYDFVIYGFDYNTSELTIGVREEVDFRIVKLFKYEEELIVSSSELYDTDKLIKAVGDRLSFLYDELFKYSDFKEEYCFKVPTDRYNYVAGISEHGVCLEYQDHFSIKGFSFKDGYESTVEDNNYRVQGYEKYLLESVKVNTENCPSWIYRDINQKKLSKRKKNK